MSTFSITTTPIQVYLGQQGVVSIINDGPNTVYLGSDTSVSPLNGFTLPPTGQMTWKGNVPLFAVTGLGESRLFTDVAGDLSVTTRASYYRQLAPPVVGTPFIGPGNNKGPITVETGFLNTLMIVWDSGGPVGLTANEVPQAQLEWMDFDQNVIYTELFTWNCMDLDSKAITQIPVKGAYCRITLIWQTGGYKKWTVYGTDRVLPARSWDSTFAAIDGAGIATYTRNDDTVFANALNLSGMAGGVMIPSLGNFLRIQWHGNITGNGSLAVVDRLSNNEIDTMDFNTANTPREVQTFQIPADSALLFRATTSGPTGGNGAVTFHYWYQT